jgi:hypothetical protein
MPQINIEERIEMVDKVLAELGLLQAPSGVQMAMISQIGELVFKRVMLRVAQELDDAQFAEFSEKMMSGDKDAFAACAQQYVPNLETYFQTEFNDVVVELKAALPAETSAQ